MKKLDTSAPDEKRVVLELAVSQLANEHAGLSARLDRTRRHLDLIERIERLRDEAVEAETTREIALFEREPRKRRSVSARGARAAVQLTSAVAALLLLLGCTARVEPGLTGEEPLPTLVPQRVTATIRREALRLVRLETEHEAFLTTPEHPFATPRSGWISAGRLRPGDWVKSERFGAVRLLSVRSEPASLPVPVFNLSVASSHAYFVGIDRVLVHNTSCQPNTTEPREEALEPREEALEPREEALESREEAIQRMVREREEINREIKALKKTTPAALRLAELNSQREKLRRRIDYLRRVQRKEQGERPQIKVEPTRQHYEAEKETARKGLEDAQKELLDLESRSPPSDEARKAALEKQIAALKLTYERTSQILVWLRELAELEKDTPSTDADRRALEERKEALSASIDLERRRAKTLKAMRKRRSDPEGRDERAKYERDVARRSQRIAAHLADTERPRDPLELLEEELAGLLQAPPSESRDARIHHLTEQIETMTKLAVARREHRRVRKRRWYALRAREELSHEGKDTREFDEVIEKADPELHALRIEKAELRVRERLLTKLAGTPWAHAPRPVDEARLREFERQLGEGLENEQQLAELERALDAMDPTLADLQEAVLDEAEDVDETLSERAELMRQRPSPERATGLQSSYERLLQELRAERVAVEAAVSQLANEYAYVQTTQAGSSSGPTWQQRLRSIHEEQVRLRAGWRTGLQTRLGRARRQLNLMQSIERFRDEAIETELIREIALLERELQNAGG